MMTEIKVETVNFKTTKMTPQNSIVCIDTNQDLKLIAFRRSANKYSHTYFAQYNFSNKILTLYTCNGIIGIGCNGTGQITKEQKSAIDFEKNMWCKCGHENGSHYVPDNSKRGVISKHHYVCNDCGKITQIG